MIRNIALFALALTAGTASAAQIPALTFTGNSNTAYNQQLGQAKSTNATFEFTFSYDGIVDGNDFLGFWVGNQSNLTEAYKGPNFGFKVNCGKTVATTCTNDVFVRTSGTDGIFVPNSNLIAGQTYTLFAHLSKTNNSNFFNRYDLWLNPTAQDRLTLTGADATATGSTGLTSFDTIGFRTSGVDKGLVLNVNEVPEPGSVALMGLALAGLAFTRRSKRG